MNIVIVSGSFYPIVHPRAFRATELAKELARLGHDVTEITCRSVPDFDYDKYSKEIGVKIINLNVFTKNRLAEVAAQKQTFFFRIKRFVIDYFLCGNLIKHSIIISRKLFDLDCWENADMVIVLSTPFQCHYGFYLFSKKRKNNFVTVLDSGDPFYYSKQVKRAIWFKYLEKNIYKKCDYLTIPTSNAIPLYTPIISKAKIRVIPQGFDMRNLVHYSGPFDEPVRIAYCGVFYWDIRNPEFLFKYLDESDVDYKFFLFTRYQDSYLDAVIKKYNNFARRVEITYNLPHENIVYELSKMHFLINIENISNTQMPSKLIDYGMAQRPIFSSKATTFDQNKLTRFMHGDYSGSYEVNVDDYNITNVANKFLELYKK